MREGYVAVCERGYDPVLNDDMLLLECVICGEHLVQRGIDDVLRTLAREADSQGRGKTYAVWCKACEDLASSVAEPMYTSHPNA